MPRSFVEQAVARCSVEGARLWFSCNPEHPQHWFYTEWILKAKEKNALYLHFTMRDNPSLSPAVHQILRDTLGFDGVILTDDLAMDAVAAYAQDGAVAVMALEAGNDLIITTDYRTQIPRVIEAVENGTLSMDTIDTACRRVLTWKQALGLL